MPIAHPLYKQHAEEWAEYRLCYEGGRPYVDRYIFRHQKEPQSFFADRLARTVHVNHTRAVVDTYAAHLFRESIPRTAEPRATNILQPFWEDIDLLGNGADEFYESAAQLVQRGGRVAIVVDRTNGAGEVRTRADEMAQGVRPYAYLVDTENIIDWDVDSRGILQWVKIRETQDTRRTWNEDHPGITYQYRIWTRDEWILVVEEESGEGEDKVVKEVVIDRGVHPCGEVPVVIVFWGRRENGELVAPSAIRDIAPMNRRLTNLQSLIDEQIAAHVFNIMAVPESTWDQLAKVDFSAYGAIPYSDTVSNPPFYLGPDVSQIQVLRQEIEKTEGAIRMLSGLGRVNEESKHVQTGIALSYLTMDKDALLAKFAARMSAAETYVDWLALKWMGIESSEPLSTRQYPTDFDPGDLNAELDDALKYATLVSTGTAHIENLILATKARLGSHIEGPELEVILEELRTTSAQNSL
jgi:hypothetical protein